MLPHSLDNSYRQMASEGYCFPRDRKVYLSPTLTEQRKVHKGKKWGMEVMPSSTRSGIVFEGDFVRDLPSTRRFRSSLPQGLSLSFLKTRIHTTFPHARFFYVNVQTAPSNEIPSERLHFFCVWKTSQLLTTRSSG